MSTTPPPPAPHHVPAPPAAPPRRLVRLPDEGKVAGVAAGIGWYVGVDPVLIRIGLIVLTIATGLGIPAYIAAWVLLPEEEVADQPAMTAPPQQRDKRTLAVVALAAMGVLALLGQVNLFSGSVLTAAVLIGMGVLLFTDGSPLELNRPAGATAPRPPGAPPPPPPPPWAAAPTPPVHPGTLGAPAPTVPASWGPGPQPVSGPQPQSAYGPYAAAWRPDPEAVQVETPRKPPSYLGAWTFAAWLGLIGVATVLDRLGVVNLTPLAIAALTIAVIGAGLLVGTFVGRARGLIPLGIIATLAALALGTAGELGVNLTGGVGERLERPQSVAQVPERYDMLVGAQEIDLTELDLSEADGPVEVVVGMAAGELIIRVPTDADVTVTGSVQAGEYTVFDEVGSGTGLRIGVSHEGTGAGAPLDIELNILAGEVTVETVDPPRPR